MFFLHIILRILLDIISCSNLKFNLMFIIVIKIIVISLFYWILLLWPETLISLITINNVWSQWIILFLIEFLLHLLDWVHLMHSCGLVSFKLTLLCRLINSWYFIMFSFFIYWYIRWLSSPIDITNLYLIKIDTCLR
jgi:hypothetical protein